MCYNTSARLLARCATILVLDYWHRCATILANPIMSESRKFDKLKEVVHSLFRGDVKYRQWWIANIGVYRKIKLIITCSSVHQSTLYLTLDWPFHFNLNTCYKLEKLNPQKKLGTMAMFQRLHLPSRLRLWD